jgi:AcrR family transcriptional regulator
MTPDQPTADGTSSEGATSWREHAVARSLDSARSRAEKRVQRFLDAALELLDTDSGKEFTVQEVVERSGQSLRSFYQYFAGKHELLLALFEESVRSTAEHLRKAIADEEDPLDRLRRFTFEYYRLCRPALKGKPSKGRRPTPAMGEFAQQLLTDHPREAAQAYVPLVTLLEQVLDDAAQAGRIREGLDHRQLVGVILQSISFNAFAATISGTPVRPGEPSEVSGEEQLWELLLRGIGT